MIPINTIETFLETTSKARAQGVPTSLVTMFLSLLESIGLYIYIVQNTYMTRKGFKTHRNSYKNRKKVSMGC